MQRLRGQTLIELLITVSVVTTGLFAASALVFSNLQLSDRDADEVVAVNLAREGIELAKEMRDSNWLAGAPFDQGLASGRDYSAAPRWTGGPAEATFTFEGGHNYEIQENDTRILEYKTGPYLGQEHDKVFICE